MLTSSLLILGVLAIGGASSHFTLVAWLVGVMLVSLLVFEWRRARHPLTPAGILALGSLLLFWLRPLTVASQGVTTAGAEADTVRFVGDVETAGSTALLQVALFLGVLALSYMARVVTPPSEDRPAPPLAVDHHMGAARFLVAVTSMFAAGCALFLVQSSGGVGAFLDGLSVRSSFLSGRYFLTLGYIPLSVALVMYLILRQRLPAARPWDALSVAATAVLVLSAFTGGGRGPVLLGAVLPLLIVKQLGPRPFRAPSLIAIGAFLITGAIVMSVFLREDAYSDGRAGREFAANPIASVGARLTSGSEARPFDSLILLNTVDQRGALQFQHGQTYLATVKWFLPSSLAGEKGGGNTWFTRNYLPRYYFPDHVETSISAPGEAYANFGIAGLVVVGMLTGLAAAAFGSRNVEGLTGGMFAALLTPLFFSFVRGDAYHNASLALLLIVGIYFSGWFSRTVASAAAPAKQEFAPTQRAAG